MASEYRYDQDEVWKAATEAAAAAVAVAKQTVADRCAELGIPARFAPTVGFSWRERGENLVKERRDELRLVAKSRIAAIEKAACTKIEMLCLDAQSQILAHGLTSASAIEFFRRAAYGRGADAAAGDGFDRADAGSPPEARSLSPPVHDYGGDP
jgi:hypothetical protein